MLKESFRSNQEVLTRLFFV